MNIKLLKQALWLFAIIFGLATNVAVAQEIRIFRDGVDLNNNSNAINPNDVIDGADGQSIKVWIKATFPQSAQNKQIKIKFGNFLQIVKYGQDDENAQNFIDFTNVQIIKDGEIFSEGQPTEKYRVNSAMNSLHNQTLNETVILPVKGTTTTVAVPVVLSLPVRLMLKGLAVDRTIDGSQEGIEKTTPISAKVIYNDVEHSEALAKKLKISSPAPVTLFSYIDQYQVPLDFAEFTNINGYEASRRFIYVPTQGFYLPWYFEELEFELHLPQEITFEMTLNADAYEVTDLGGGKHKFVMKKPTFGVPTFRFKMKLDPATVANDDYKIFNPKILQKKVRLRNYSAVTSNTYGRVDTPFTVVYTKLSAGENFSFFGKPAVNTPAGNSHFFAPNQPQHYIPYIGATPYYYHRLIGYGYTNFYRNLNDTPTEEKEIWYKFTENDNVAVKAVRLIIPNVPYVKTRSKLNPNWKTTHLTGKTNANYVTVNTLGYAAEDELLDVIVPIGVIPANGLVGQNYGTKQSDILGVVKQAPAAGQSYGQDLMQMFLRTKDYNEDNPDPQHKSYAMTEVIKAYVGNGTPYNNIRINSDVTGTKIINSNSQSSINYLVVSRMLDGRAHWGDQNRIDVVNKLAFVYPKEMQVTAINLKDSKNQPINNVPFTIKDSGDKNIYTIDLKGLNVDKLTRLLGLYNIPGEDVATEGKISAEVVFKNRATAQKTVLIDKTMFVEIETPASHTGAVTVRSDDYDIDEDGKVGTADDNVFTTNSTYSGGSRSLFLNVGYRVGLGVRAKLDTDNAWTNLAGTNTKFALKSINQALQLEYQVSNNSTVDLGPLDLFIPIPKKGQNWGPNFQTEAFTYDLKLNGTMQPQGDFATYFDIEYAAIPQGEIDGAMDITKLKNKQYGQAVTEQTNMIRIKTKANKLVPASQTLTIQGNFVVSNAQDSQDGNELKYNSLYQANMAQYGDVIDTTDPFSVRLALGKIKVELFNDTDLNGLKSNAETAYTTPLLVEAYNNQNVKVDSKNTSAGTVVLDGLVSTNNYTIRIVNNNVNEHFTTESALTDDPKVARTTQEAKINELQALVSVGITNAKTTVIYQIETADQAKGKLAGNVYTKTVQGFFSDKLTDTPTVTATAPYVFLGWIINQGDTPISHANMLQKTYGKTNVTYKAVFGSKAGDYGHLVDFKEPATPIHAGTTPQAGDFVDKTQLPTEAGAISTTWLTAPSTCPTNDPNALGYQKVKIRIKFSDNSFVDKEGVVSIQPRQDLFGTANIVYDVCAGKAMPALTTGAEPNTGAGGFTYKWQVKKGNANWTDIASANQKDYTPAVEKTPGVYKYRKISTRGNCVITSEEITVNVKSCYGASINGVGTRR